MSDEEILHTGEVEREQLNGLIKDCNFPAEALFLAERLPEMVIKASERLNLLCFSQFSNTLPFEQYTSGRIFNWTSEFRWEKQNKRVRVVYLGENRGGRISSVLSDYGIGPHAGDEPKNLTKKSKPTEYCLFGTRLQAEDIEKIGEPAAEGDFAEVRIHRLLKYPQTAETTGAERLCLQVCEYVEEETGHVRLFRFQGLTIPAAEKDGRGRVAVES